MFVFAEDRADSEVGLRLALASLFRHLPDARVVAYWPCETEEFRDWSRAYPGLKVIPGRPEHASSWNCKPHAILPLFDEGWDEVVWVDSDMLITRDPSSCFDGLGPETLVTTEEPLSQPHPGSDALGAGWGLKPGRNLPVSINSSVLRVTRRHIPLLQRWKECLADPRYVETQQMPFHVRPQHLMSDQDVIFALLGSEEFSDIPLRYLLGGIDIIHCGGALGYSTSRRLQGLFRGVPTFLHAISGKPWWVLTPSFADAHPHWFTVRRRLLQETSPYVREAGRYRQSLGIECDWVDYRSPLGLVLRFLGCGHFALRGLPMSLLASATTGARRVLTKARRLSPR